MKKIVFLSGLYISLFFYVKLSVSQISWELILPPSPTTNQLVSLDFIDETTGCAVGEYGTILKTTDAGESWRIIEIPQMNYLSDIYFPTPLVGYIVGKDGIVLKSTDSGETWISLNSAYTNNLRRVRFRNENTGFVVGENGLILFTNDGGISWEQQTSSSRSHLNGIALFRENHACIVGNDTTILWTENDGQEWQNASFRDYRVSDDIQFNDVFFLNENEGWIGGQENRSTGTMKGILLKTTDGGITWNEFRVRKSVYVDLQQNESGCGNCIYTGVRQIYFFSNQNGIYLLDNTYENPLGSTPCSLPFGTQDGGRTWFSQISGFNENHHQQCQFAWLSEQRTICTAYRGEFLISADNGFSWNFPNTNKRSFKQLKIGCNGQLLGYRRVEKYKSQWSFSNDYGKNWQSFEPAFFNSQGKEQHGIACSYLGDFVDNGKTLMTTCSLDSNKEARFIYKSNDFGRCWNLIHTDARNSLYKPLFLSADTLIQYYLRLREVSPDNYRAELQFHYSFDCGRTTDIELFQNIWNLGPTLDPFVAKHYFFNGHTGFLVGSDGNIIKTTDTGRSWENIPSGVVEDLWDMTFVNRQTGFVVGDFGRILKTEDGGQTWRKTDSGTQEDVYSIGFKNETEGWAGTETGLRYTRDGGETWQGVPLRYFHGPVREIEFDKDGTGYAYTHKLYPNEDKNSRPGGYFLLMVLKEGGVVVENTPTATPYQFTLSQNYPNPFNSTTHIRFSLPENEPVSLKIYNIQGQLVRTLLDEVRKPGEHAVVWDGTTNSGQLVASGVYFYRLTRNGEVRVRKLLVLK